MLLERVVKKGWVDFEIKRVWTSSDLINALESETWDAVLCDYMMPEFSVSDAMDVIRKRDLDLPFIIVSGTISDETAVAMMKAGAHDYLTKNNLSRLVPALEREINEAEHRHKRRVAEEQLRLSERKHRMLVESLTDTVLVLTSDGTISEFYSQNSISDSFRGNDYLSKRITTVFTPIVAQKINFLLTEVLRNKVNSTFEYPLHGRWYSARISPHEDHERVVMVIRDVTDLKEAEEEARQAHAVAMLYQDITGHDIRNLLQAIMIASDLLQADETDKSKISLIHHISEAVTEASELISAVQATATLLSTPLEKTSLDFTLKSCIRLFNEENKDVSVTSDMEVSEAVVNADRFLCHLLMNVFSNAVKHNNSNEKKIWTHLGEDDDGYELTVADNGPGIKDGQKKNLLNPERRSGGVGILQCIQIASKYGGKFELLDRVDGDSSQGAKVRLWIPKAEV
ncbi:MAG: response regulator [Candidatus Thorarchaeota archaeon]|nr:response regulator [Candidatus Thorarchaeota archaeon]